jgi:hypothetical protein
MWITLACAFHMYRCNSIIHLKNIVMKKFLLYFSIPVLFVACTNGPAANTKTATIDTAGLAAFQQFKAMNEQKALAMYYGQTTEPAAKTVVYRKAAAPRKQRVVNDDGAMVSESSHPAKAAKKGWSKAAKGAAIGTAAGAVAGVLINKRNRTVGGVVGGVAGGVIGYGIGRGMDKKDGRY